MKAQVRNAIPSEHSLHLLKATMKPKQETAEMRACFSKLKELVPTVPSDKKVSNTQLIQHVIDYIMDLESALEWHPANNNITPKSFLSDRTPLVESSQINRQVRLYS